MPLEGGVRFFSYFKGKNLVQTLFWYYIGFATRFPPPLAPTPATQTKNMYESVENCYSYDSRHLLKCIMLCCIFEWIYVIYTLLPINLKNLLRGGAACELLILEYSNAAANAVTGQGWQIKLTNAEHKFICLFLDDLTCLEFWLRLYCLIS
jgi:hypothetical protein